MTDQNSINHYLFGTPLPPEVESKVRKILSDDNFVAKVGWILKDYSMSYAGASEYDSSTRTDALKQINKIVKNLIKMVCLHAETMKLMVDAKPKVYGILGNMDNHDNLVSRLANLESSDFDSSVARFCDSLGKATDLLPKDKEHAITTARREKLMKPLRQIFLEHNLTPTVYATGEDNVSELVRLALILAKEAGDRGATLTALGQII